MLSEDFESNFNNLTISVISVISVFTELRRSTVPRLSPHPVIIFPFLYENMTNGQEETELSNNT